MIAGTFRTMQNGLGRFRVRNKSVINSTEDKQAYCAQGCISEEIFLQTVAEKYGLSLSINPDKASDKYAVDFISAKQTLVDLKHIQTPFFKAGAYGYDANHTITMNHKDYIHYMNETPEWSEKPVYLLFWVDWKTQARYGIDVKGAQGLWTASIHQIDKMIRDRELACHEYIKRGKSTGTNARSSWLIDLRRITKLNVKTDE